MLCHFRTGWAVFKHGINFFSELFCYFFSEDTSISNALALTHLESSADNILKTVWTCLTSGDILDFLLTLILKTN